MPDDPLRDRVHSQPLVSVITPVYNGEAHLVQCIESVLAQTYQHWEYVIVDNSSTDRTSDIAHRYAARDSRIHVHRNERLVSVAENHQIGFRQMAAESKYCKVVHSDDWIFPDCLDRMVALAESDSRIGVVSAYALEGEWVGLGGVDYSSSQESGRRLGGLTYPTTVMSGREACRLVLTRWAYLFGSPSSILLRVECIRQREEFYNEELFPRHFDTAVCCELMRDWDFGFVHQVLTYTRQHPEAQSAVSVKINSYLAEDLSMVTKYGRWCMEPSEWEKAIKPWRMGYRRFLAISLLRRHDEGFWKYHRGIVRTLGWSLNPVTLFGAVLADSMDSLASYGKKRVGRLMLR
jgi:glycosyltransferase involved in cell wall biosynthesis